MKNIYLIGMRGTGKTSVGKLLSEKLKLDFVDMDEKIIANEGKTITEIIEENGWGYFRRKEQIEVERFSQEKDLVIGTGGGVLMFFDNAVKLKNSGTLILLTAESDTIMTRISESEDRPPLNGKDFLHEIEKVWQERKETYEKNSDITVDTEGKNLEDIANEIIEKAELKP